MSLQSIARVAFSAIKTAIPESVVVVVCGTQTANGIRDTVRTDAGLTNMGEEGITGGTVRLDASEMDEPERGATITVAGENVFVLHTRKDSSEALLAIEFSRQRPVE